MNNICKIIISALAATRAEYQAYPTDVSRQGKNIQFVYQISAQGSHTPHSKLNYAKDASEEPNELGYVTPLGIRQQYMIGNELRYRYVEDMVGQFLETKYDITQTFIQTSWNDTSILSSQAMMLGIYPPGENNYVLEESQKYNAVPPIEGFDFKPWIDEMGLEALPHQTTIFPIQMNGWSYDYMLALDDINCPKRKEARDAKSAEMKAAADEIAKADYPKGKLPEFFAAKGGAEKACEYINWAYTESIQVNEAFTTDSGISLDQAWASCNKIGANFTQEYNLIDDSLKGISSNDLRFNLQKRVVTWANQTGLSQADASSFNITAQLAEITKEKWLVTTAGSEAPKYSMFHTNEQHLSMIAQSLSSDTRLTTQLPLSPSSTIVIEFTKESNADLMVKAYVDDQQVSLKACGDQLECKALDFQKDLATGIQITDVPTACK